MQSKILFERQLKNSIKKIIKEILLENEQDERIEVIKSLNEDKEKYIENMNLLYGSMSAVVTKLEKMRTELEDLNQQKKYQDQSVIAKMAKVGRFWSTIRNFVDTLELSKMEEHSFNGIIRGMIQRIERPTRGYTQEFESGLQDAMSKLVSQYNLMVRASKELKEKNIIFIKNDQYFTEIIAALDSAITKLEKMSSEGATRTTIKIKPNYYRENKKIRRGRFVK